MTQRIVFAVAACALLTAGGAFAQEVMPHPHSPSSAPTRDLGPPIEGSAASSAGGRVTETLERESKTNDAVNTTRQESRTAAAPVAGANSFTEGEARRRMESFGYTDVSQLTKDEQGIWRGRAAKNGATVDVALDYQGNIVADKP